MIFIAVMIWGIFDLRIQLFVKTITTTKGGILLTFDDGPDKERTPAILDLLLKKDISAIFFVIGSKVEENTELTKKIIANGHVVGGHSYSHKIESTFYSTRSCIDEIQKCNVSIEKATHQKCSIYRPPFGVSTPSMGKAFKELGTMVIGWSVRSVDTKLSSKVALSRLKRRTRMDSIVLLHDAGSLSIADLEHYIDHCIERGYLFANAQQFIQDHHAA